MVLLEEIGHQSAMEVEEGEIVESSTSSEQSDATPCQDLVPLSTVCLIQNLRADEWRHIIYGILKGILKRLESCNMENLDAIFRSSEIIGTNAILEFRGDPSYWTAFCAPLAKSIHDLTAMCRPIPCDSTRQEKIIKWEAEFEKWKKLVQRDLDVRRRIIEMRLNRDRLVLELCKTTAITIDRNGGLVQQIKHQEDAIDVITNEANQVDAMRKEASAECNRLRISVMQSDSGRVQREVNAHAIYRHVCFTVKSLMEKL
ncbi:hypothetical protein FCM35_KLT15560 [Carex littledalei]|uniref:Uncharacterized protein n=1 Tax=Carex littledalei TaxID=544730 RepID=A0A833REG1_9POAL|nr:hypothetical protein FCM35_KLT15560 [Carex littledalei]